MKEYIDTINVRSKKIKTTPQKAWSIIGDIASMPRWAPGVKKVIIKSKNRRGIGAVRDVVFDDGRVIEEHVVLWDAKKRFTYVATAGLPLHVYVATISINEKTSEYIDITWQSYLTSNKMPKKDFQKLLCDMHVFYDESLKNMRRILQIS